MSCMNYRNSIKSPLIIRPEIIFICEVEINNLYCLHYRFLGMTDFSEECY